jgi:CRP-like cAMP-binding protein
MTNLQEQEALIEDHISKGDVDEAVKLLYDLSIYFAKAKDFKKAEELRDKLIQVNSMALTEIIKSAEIIEAEKTASVDKKHQQIWLDLYETLTPEEGNDLYYSLEKVELDPDQTILQQGRLNSKLFFVDQGTLKVVFSQEDQLSFVKDIMPSETAGDDTFFSISLCTTSTITTSGVQIKYLTRAKFDIIAEKFPGFADKLESFCRKITPNSISEILKQKEVERRQHQRHNITGKIITQLLHSDGKLLSSPFAGSIDDLSRGGLSYSIKCSKQSTARMLLGRPAQLQMEVQLGQTSTTIMTKGQIVCAKGILFNDYSIHVKFSKLLTDQQLLDVNLPT